VCCLLVLNLVSSTLSCIRQPRPRLKSVRIDLLGLHPRPLPSVAPTAQPRARHSILNTQYVWRREELSPACKLLSDKIHPQPLHVRLDLHDQRLNSRRTHTLGSSRGHRLSDSRGGRVPTMHHVLSSTLSGSLRKSVKKAGRPGRCRVASRETGIQSS
jgi:hypothetical protein